MIHHGVIGIQTNSCEVLAGIIEVNDTIEELVLEKNLITAAGANFLAKGLTSNTSVRTLNLLQQRSNNFGEECMDNFIAMRGLAFCSSIREVVKGDHSYRTRRKQ